MAVDDIITDMEDTAAAGNFDFQPAAGVEVIITIAFDNKTATTSLMARDGTIQSVIADGADIRVVSFLKWGITNAIFIRLNNAAGGAIEQGFSGIQTK